MTNLPANLPTVDESLIGRIADEFTERLNRDDHPDIEEYAQRYPELADVLRQALGALQMIRPLSAGLVPAPGAPADADLPGTLGDFRILREIGRGGMGIVYEAEQLSLSRRVALKVLPFAATMDPRQLQRFKNEAHAAAQLHHSNIVPVYSVGCDRGVHFYAMQHIEGQSLADVITSLPPGSRRQPAGDAAASSELTAPYERAEHRPANAVSSPETKPIAALSTVRSIKDAAYFRTVAELGIQAAEALDYAHERGVIHRDIKPANLMVDTTDRLWVTDFGLAHVQSDIRLTLTGDLVGTLRYMSPEQALAKRVVVDHRTDIYSLGATLYELLTLVPAFSGTDRNELLRQITFDEPKSPRRRNKSIPRELETIVLKAVEKNPADRYATARELAEDLRRFLHDEPIRAQRANLLTLARKWANRHRALVWSSATIFTVIGLMLAGMLGWVVNDRANRQAAIAAEVKRAFEEVQRLQEQDKLWDALQIARQTHSLLQSGSGENPLQLQVRDRLKDLEMALRLQQIHLAYQPNLSGGELVRMPPVDNAYTKAFAEYGIDIDQLEPLEAARRVHRTSVGLELALALDIWTRVRRIANKTGDGWKRVEAVARAADGDEWRNAFRRTWDSGDDASFKKSLETLAASAPLSKLHPQTIVLLALALRDIGDVEQAITLLQSAQRRHRNDFWINQELAWMLGNRTVPDFEKAIRYFTASLALQPNNASTHSDLAECYRRTGDLESAMIECQEALGLAKDFQGAHVNLGNALLDMGRVDEAIDEYHEAIRLRNNDPVAHSNLGNAFAHKGQREEAIAEYRKAISLKKDFAEPHHNLAAVLFEEGQIDLAIAEVGKAIEIKPDDAIAHHALGQLLRAQGKVDDAIAEFRTAIKIKSNPGFKSNLAKAYLSLGAALCDVKQDYDGAIAAFQAALRIDPRLAPAHHNLGVALEGKRHFDEAIAEFRMAIELEPRYARAHRSLGNLLMNQGRFEEAIAEFRAAIGLKKDDTDAKTNLELAERLQELDRKLPKVLSGKQPPADGAECIALAELCQLPSKKHYREAIRLYEAAFAKDPKLVGDLPSVARYNAACAAGLAGCGQGQDADRIDLHERTRLRQQALTWLKAELAAWHKVLNGDQSKAAPAVHQQMQHWLQDTDFAGVRGPEALAKLPETERQEWQTLWAEVERLRQRTGDPPKKPVTEKPQQSTKNRP